MKDIHQINSITEAHQSFGLTSPKHPLISVVWAKDFPSMKPYEGMRYTSDLFMVSMKDGVVGSMGYGRNSYDFTEGMMVFSRPHQVLTVENKTVEDEANGWMLIFHPDLIRKSELGRTIDEYTFFDYKVHEALHLSDEEQSTLMDLVLKIEREINQNMDKHSQKLMISTIELMLDFCNRYYDRQFYVRTNYNKDLVATFEQIIKEYYQSQSPTVLGVLSVKACAEKLNMSPNYLGDMIKTETGRSAKDYINDYVINKAKNMLLGSGESVSEIAFTLGFEYPQGLSKLFKSKVGMSPSQYRNLN